jgi:hypothetical protein
MTYDDETMLGAGYRDIHSPQVCEEADVASLVASDGREDHNLFFSALPSVDCLDLRVWEMILQDLLELCILS